MRFEQAVRQTPEIRRAWRPGLQALSAVDRSRVSVEDSRALTGSVDLDGFLAEKYANESRWDYGIGYKEPSRSGEKVSWLEVHPGKAGEAAAVLAKLAWLKNWLRASGSPLNRLGCEYVWVASGRTSGNLGAPIRKKLAQDYGLLYAGRRVGIPFVRSS